ncbi:hypothetical protein ACO22_03245 [Paracoccidioides brasiliensis]|uniref:Uncharacterized protein n=1 Tax=Paracoccidioides brasiliensis TaxID=121759 RepID=A0A1D2JGF0_PARBR|nr:hypothetical protein ACO22_03245 [Paracoccidioides brasiliensis]
MAGKKTTTGRRGRPSRVSTGKSDSDHGLFVSSTPADLLKDLSSAVEKRNKHKWQKLRAQHRAQVKKTEEGIQTMAYSNKLSIYAQSMRHRRAQIKRLSELVKKRTEIELAIVAEMQTLGDLYETVHGELELVLSRRISNLK